ncbi:hypothetical protein EI77_04778 [Prosthecobacter fusiformis]|uniref:Uncharacterized protein n=1 Tax=Prosthecobacter fusiformis TaxID=48464 RepID=A0A4R7RL46_9BACT|nr:hypothetical protein EI77_04778 [Prosthecobacter fusiformis]
MPGELGVGDMKACPLVLHLQERWTSTFHTSNNLRQFTQTNPQLEVPALDSDSPPANE